MLQLPVPNNPGANIPLAAGYLKAWAFAQGLTDLVEIEILPRDLADRAGDALLADAIAERRPDVLALSLYTWNSERTLSVAARARAALPGLLVIAGGPEVQQSNQWVLRHEALDLAVEGEGEQTFAALLRHLLAPPAPGCRWCVRAESAIPLLPEPIPGTIHRHGAELIIAPPRPSLPALGVIPSPYELGYLELRPGEMALIECSRWCPYGCTFCLYGRNMGAKLGGRSFGAERVLAEVAWARERGAGAIHFVEANLNLIPIFRDLMAGLHQANADPRVPLYAELRGEHLGEASVDALARAGLRVAEVGLQSANPAALAAVGRRTDLEKWAAGARRLYARGVEVLLDVILGLPEDDRETTLRTVAWIEEQGLGPYDIFTLQVLPGTGIRADAERWGLRFQDRPPYYVLETHRMSYAELRGLRWELREAAGLDPRAVEGLPEPRDLLGPPVAGQALQAAGPPIDRLALDCAAPLSLADWAERGAALARSVASHLVVEAFNADLAVIEALCLPIAAANPTIHWDLVLDDPALAPAELRALRGRWPHEVGYLDRVAVYRSWRPEPDWHVVSPRLWLAAPWGDPLDLLRFEGLAEIVWRLPATLPDPSALAESGAAAVIVEADDEHIRQALAEAGLRVWAQAAV
ncbi:MAG TPA: radical SAM protein, partial [Herpetosiphonaceae bacterium]